MNDDGRHTPRSSREAPAPAARTGTGGGSRAWRGLRVLLPVLLTACATQGPPRPAHDAVAVRAEIARRMPATTADRTGWAGDIQIAFDAQRIEPNAENICAVLAVIEQESGYRADPVVAGLPAIARREIDRRASALHVPKRLVDAALAIRSTDGRTYAQRLRGARTERELSEIYEDMIGRVPLGKRLFADMNPVQTAGPMQVSIAFAEAHARGYPYPVEGSIRREAFSRRGGLYFGIAHLLGYETPYTRKLHRFADYNAGWYASRNAAFQNAAGLASGIELALDGDLLRPGARLDEPGQTERAVRALGASLGMDDRAIRNALARGDRLEFDDTDLYVKVFALAEVRARTPLPRALVPGIRLESPKITRDLTTAWFATRVNDRYQRCMRR
ncbi:MAG TPA: DUF1615 domain-containing protein [Dokdonella sp.]|uniref:DUF1615 domain-containing protein n=1 Tax=Dokdonella sp. TaxID=2291710 RepID=UPI002B5E552C|nr:DUF1615 domain-containing protein [Dokdonella sp.]HUD40660.1 DUF1615 domain-containing protein [Dokdonella sp.]